MTWLLILYAEFVVMMVMLIPSPYPLYSSVNIVIFQSFAFLAFASHLRAMFTDPVSIDFVSNISSNSLIEFHLSYNIIINYIILRVQYLKEMPLKK